MRKSTLPAVALALAATSGAAGAQGLYIGGGLGLSTEVGGAQANFAGCAWGGCAATGRGAASIAPSFNVFAGYLFVHGPLSIGPEVRFGGDLGGRAHSLNMNLFGMGVVTTTSSTQRTLSAFLGPVIGYQVGAWRPYAFVGFGVEHQRAAAHGAGSNFTWSSRLTATRPAAQLAFGVERSFGPWFARAEVAATMAFMGESALLGGLATRTYFGASLGGGYRF